MRFRKVPGNNKRMDTQVNLWENSLVNVSNKSAIHQHNAWAHVERSFLASLNLPMFQPA
jgi:hypothetical protein